MSSAARIAANRPHQLLQLAVATATAQSARARRARDWLAAREADLLPVRLFPRRLHAAGRDRADRLPEQGGGLRPAVQRSAVTAAETLLTIAADPKHLGARIGVTSVLHSWGSAMTHHPHVHMIVPGGGISLDGTRWVPCKPGFLLPVRVLSRLFRRLFLAELATPTRQASWRSSARSRVCSRRAAFDAHLALAQTEELPSR